MKPFRLVLGALLPLLLAVGAAAGVVSVPQRLAGYQAGLTSYRTGAAASFLRDDAAQALLRARDPGMLAPSFQRAHEILDLAALPGQYEDAANLRRALVARDSEPSFRRPADIRAFYAGRGLASAEMRKVVAALAEWRTLDAELRGWLGAAGATEELWEGLTVDERSSAIVAALREQLLQGRRLSMDGTAYRARLEEFARRAAPYMSANEDYRMDRTLERHEALAADLRRARRAARRARDEGLSAVLGAVSAAGDMDAARGALDRLAESDAPGSTPEKISKRTLAAVSARLPAAVKRWAAGTPAEPVLDRALGRVELDQLETALGGYQNETDRLIVSRENLGLFLLERGRKAGDLLTDDALLADFALEMAPIIVHETTHRLQRLHADASRMTTTDAAMLYGHEDEREAFTVQALFVKAFAKRHPERAAAFAGSERLSFFWKPETIAKTIAAVPYGYSNVPSAHGSRARAVTLAAFKAAEPRTGPKAAAGARVDRQLKELDRFNAYLDAMDARLRAWTRALRRAAAQR
ncbi:MAG: hypothetical protein HYV14_06805 [Elusimicrobia bacterium]|nr:hypothetical protein [Elusimicrobiota bacterium]